MYNLWIKNCSCLFCIGVNSLRGKHEVKVLCIGSLYLLVSLFFDGCCRCSPWWWWWWWWGAVPWIQYDDDTCVMNSDP